MSEQILHCWADYYDHLERTHGYGSQAWHDAMFAAYAAVPEEACTANATCFLEAGHDGPHEWTPDSSISIAFTGGDDA